MGWGIGCGIGGRIGSSAAYAVGGYRRVELIAIFGLEANTPVVVRRISRDGQRGTPRFDTEPKSRANCLVFGKWTELRSRFQGGC